jgi:hypothetical protein
VVCRELNLAVFTLRHGETVELFEPTGTKIDILAEDLYVLGRIWGSRQIPQVLSIELDAHFVPLRLEKMQIGGGSPSIATVRFVDQGSVVTLQPSNGPWLEKFALLFRAFPGASEKFASAGSPFLHAIDFREYERAIKSAG